MQSIVISYALRNEDVAGNAIASGIGLTVGGQLLGVAYLAYGGLAIVGLVYSQFSGVDYKPGYLIIHNSRSPLIFV